MSGIPTALLLLAAVVAGWGMQTLLSWRQATAFRRDCRLLADHGQVSVGAGGRRYRGGRAFVALAVDDAGVVKDARVLSGWTTFARSTRLPELRGVRVSRLAATDSRPGAFPAMDSKTRLAAREAAALLIAARSAARTKGAATIT